MILAALFTILIGLYLYIQYMVHRKKQSFKKRNIPLFKGRTYLLILKSLLGWNHQSERVDEIYWMHPEEEAVAIVGLAAQVIIRNPDCIERILIKDFAFFHDRVKTDGQIRNPMDANMFILSGNTWRAVRNKFSPLFTSGKLRFMYEAISDCGKELSRYLARKDGQEVDMCEVMGLFGMDVTGSTTFGIEPHVLKKPDSEFRKVGKELVNINFRDTLKGIFMAVFPKFRRLLGLREKADAQDYFCRVVRDTLKYREEGGFTRNDFVQMLLALKRKGKIDMQISDPGDGYLLMEKGSETFGVELTDDIIIGGAFIFLVTGFHITPMTLAFTLLEVARRPEVVNKMREEIDKVAKGKTPTYDQLRGMTYCENVIKEAMRLHPVAPNIQRLCTKEYTLPNGGIIEVGESILIPTQAIQMDPAYWPEPELFSPERFDVDDPRPGTYLPFGEGPRMCIAMRFVMLQMKFALVTLIREFDFTLSEKNKLPIKLAARLFSKTPADGIIFHVKKRNSTVNECE